jgi:hypothetical protein
MKHSIKIFTVALLLSLFMTSQAFAGTWKEDSNGWRWQEKDELSPVSSWEWIDSNKDGLAERYYFDENGYLLTNTTTPDGYTVNEAGAWVADGIVRQKAANPAAASTAKKEGRKLYFDAIQKSSELAGLDISGDVHMSLTYSDMEIPISMKLGLKYHDINTPNMEFLSETAMQMLGSKDSHQSFYTNGTYYSNGGANKKYMMKIGHEDMTKNLTIGGLTGQFWAFVDNVQIAEDASGDKTLLYASSGNGLEPYLDKINNRIWPLLNELDYKIDGISGKAIFTPEGYFSKEDITVYMTVDEDDDTAGFTMNIKLDYNNPGQTVAISFPSTEGYEVVVY